MLLAVDTSTQTMGLALYNGVQVPGEMLWQTKTHHTVELAPAVEDLLKRFQASSASIAGRRMHCAGDARTAFFHLRPRV